MKKIVFKMGRGMEHADADVGANTQVPLRLYRRVCHYAAGSVAVQI